MDISNADQLLALAWAGGNREKLRLLFALDQRLAGIIAGAREPVIAQMKLAWWRENLLATPDIVKKGEPLLGAIHDLGLGAPMAGVADGWEALLNDLPLEADHLMAHATARGGGLFAAAARLWKGASVDGVADAGALWALMDFAQRCSDQTSRDRAFRLATALDGKASLPRPLGVLHALARTDLARGPDRAWRPGHPRRALRAARFVLLRR